MDYKGKRGRAKLKAYYEGIQLDDDTILKTFAMENGTAIKNTCDEMK